MFKNANIVIGLACACLGCTLFILFRDFVYVERPAIVAKSKPVIIARRVPLTITSLYGIVGPGSALFDYTKAVQGWEVRTEVNNVITLHRYCLNDDLQKTINTLKLEHYSKDSIIK